MLKQKMKQNETNNYEVRKHGIRPAQPEFDMNQNNAKHMKTSPGPELEGTSLMQNLELMRYISMAAIMVSSI